jgi:hypothetical protein
MLKLAKITAVSSLALLAGCDLFPKSDTTGTNITPLLFFSIGDPRPGGPPVGTFQDALDGWSYVFDNHDPANPLYLCQHTDEQMLVKAAENDFPLEEVCQTDADVLVTDPAAPPPPSDPPPPPVFPMTHTGRPGTNPTPPGYGSWIGANEGGCGVWSVAMCDRRLGLMDPTSQVVQGEWETIADAIHMDRTDGSSNAQDRAAYYRSYGYCIVDKRFDGTTADYEEVRDNLDTCDVKVRMYRRAATGRVFGHVETVTSASDRNMVTNSWGGPAAIEGGTAGRFGHWKDGKRWMEDDGDPTYPPDSTDVMITYVCPCTHPMMESLGQRILRTVTGG